MASQLATGPFRKGLLWGGLAGALVAVIVLAAAIAGSGYGFVRRGGADTAQASKSAHSAIPTNTPRLLETTNGTGELQGWAIGESGTPGGYGSVAVMTVAVIDAVGDTQDSNHVHVYLTDKTQVVIEGAPYDKGRASSPASALFGENGPGTDPLAGGLLTIEFHRVGGRIVADRINEPINSGTDSSNPWN